MTKPEFTQRHARKYAAKFRAEHDHEPVVPEPSDDALAAAFANCVRPARPEEYPTIRESIRTWR